MQKTAYEMRISDWSSDVCSSDLFLGPNGTGKTALLDAFQIVLLAADSNKTHFNASGESKKRARTLREYCLGVYGQSDAERCRPAANTYINLVFRDPETGLPFTEGVSLSARVADPHPPSPTPYILKTENT